MTQHDIAQTSRSAADADRFARVALTWLADPGNSSVWSMVQQSGAIATLDQLLAGDIADADRRAAVAARTRGVDARRAAEIAMRRADRSGIRLVTPSDSEWPTSLDDLATTQVGTLGGGRRDAMPPLCLWVRGDWSLSDAFTRSVAIVGARAATSYSIRITTDFASDLADRGWTVTSGGAYGIDAAAHRGTLTVEGGRTVAVLAGGLDRPSPTGNAALFDLIANRGLLVSEWPAGAEPLRHRFLLRNRIIAAVTAGTVVVEAAPRSGTSRMLGCAIDLIRPAMIVPGPITSVLSQGCHALLRRHPATRVVTSVDDVLEDIGQPAV
ncbi:DNA-processing protein DprA [Actinoplanes flavus]|uniref:DNA-protecting protein DprA n=1 Tax=Actinoplanes flavus TaxID=2820290 RepID=A0ABS3UE05_9ACTN|nr:DNA-processing protein DprA [Actinoplanes flavus]MBO3736676.1 DNA-protecting protein DprA [Actinoplanes flavus]